MGVSCANTYCLLCMNIRIYICTFLNEYLDIDIVINVKHIHDKQAGGWVGGSNVGCYLDCNSRCSCPLKQPQAC